MADAGGLWSVVLSGGEGTRLRPLVRQVTGEDRPKQYAKLLGPRSLLRQTLDRVALAVPAARTVLVTHRQHIPYLTEEFAGSTEPPYVLVQPEDRGTAAGILYAAHWIAWRDPAATIAVFPSDHVILGEATFMSHVTHLARGLGRGPDRLVLLGAQPTSPEADNGWIEPASPATAPDEEICRVRRFWKADAAAPRWPGAGCLASTGVMVARAATLVRLGAEALPEMSARLAGIQAFWNTDEQGRAVQQAFARMPRAGFARSVLEPYPERLAVSGLPRVSWYDLGQPHQVLEVLSRMRVRPAWAALPGRPSAGDPAPEPVEAAGSLVSR
jgi:mannose-1-phosphate guanylyltransferase